jgi:K+-transporting ATPase ATPase C chain
MLKSLLTAIRVSAVTLLLTGLLYPLVTTALAQLLFHDHAGGSLLTDEKGQLVGSELIGQGFKNPGYFEPRPSAAGNDGFDANGSSGSNLGPTSKKLRERIEQDLARIQKANPEAVGPVPSELLSASASGLDPEISPEAAVWQIPRVARARGVIPERVRTLVSANTEGPELGLLGEPRVNVLLLNLALDRQFGRPARTATTAPAAR